MLAHACGGELPSVCTAVCDPKSHPLARGCPAVQPCVSIGARASTHVLGGGRTGVQQLLLPCKMIIACPGPRGIPITGGCAGAPRLGRGCRVLRGREAPCGQRQPRCAHGQLWSPGCGWGGAAGARSRELFTPQQPAQRSKVTANSPWGCDGLRAREKEQSGQHHSPSPSR